MSPAPIPCVVGQGSPVVFKAVVVHAVKYGELELLDPGYLCVGGDGRIKWLDSTIEGKGVAPSDVVDLGTKIIMPGFVDTHCHAPQYPNAGTGMDLPLLEWLEKYTFPTEKHFSDPLFARDVYERVVLDTLRNGSTTVSYFATIHLEASKILADVCVEYGQRAYVGKVNMDRNSPDFYVETTAESIQATEDFIAYCKEVGSPLITPVITPRFVPTCTPELLAALGGLHERHKLPLQSHLSENPGEVEWVQALHPDSENYAHVYDMHGCLSERAYMAHCVLCTPPEQAMLLDRRVGVAACANSNMTLGSGIPPIVDYIKAGLKVGLGTDVSGGYSPSMLNAVRSTSFCAQAHRFACRAKGEAEHDHLSFRELFYLATMGGARVLNLEGEVGNFLPGKQFDALVVDAEALPLHRFGSNSTLDMVEKFLFNGDDRNIAAVFVGGAKVL